VRSFQSKKEDMWRAYHQMRISPKFIGLWTELLQKVISESPEPTFYQEVTDRLFEATVKTAFPIDELSTSSASTEMCITYQDANVIRYIAGYVCRKVRDKIEKSSFHNKAALLICLTGLLAEEGETAATASADWVAVVDRGGLVHVKEGTYMLFCAMEEEVRENFQMAKLNKMTEGYKERMEGAVIDNDDVLFQWCMLTPQVSDSDAGLVLEMLVKMWITIRGFSFASGWLELYKQQKMEQLKPHVVYIHCPRMCIYH